MPRLTTLGADAPLSQVQLQPRQGLDSIAHVARTPASDDVFDQEPRLSDQGTGIVGAAVSRTHDLSRVNPFEPLSVTWGYQGSTPPRGPRKISESGSISEPTISVR
jgi:hypothetical protein